MSRITSEIALFIVVKSREVLPSLSIMLLVWLSDPGQPVGSEKTGEPPSYARYVS